MLITISCVACKRFFSLTSHSKGNDLMTYRIAGKFGGELNSAVWRSDLLWILLRSDHAFISSSQSREASIVICTHKVYKALTKYDTPC